MSAPPVALVTGAARRLGAAIAFCLARAGYGVVVHHRDSGKAAGEVATAIQAEGGRAAVIAADLSDSAACAGLIGRASLPLGPVRALVNNASLFLRDDAWDFDPAVWDRQLAVNLRAPALLVRELARTLPAGERAAVVHLADCKVANLRPEFFSYSVAKAALAAMTELQARALAPRIRVNAVAPGLVLPSGAQTPARFREVHDQNLLERGTRPEDVAEAVLVLLRAEAVTGQILHVDGGDRFTENRFDPAIGGG